MIQGTYVITDVLVAPELAPARLVVDPQAYLPSSGEEGSTASLATLGDRERPRIAGIALATSIWVKVTSHLHSSRGSRGPPSAPLGGAPPPAGLHTAGSWGASVGRPENAYVAWGASAALRRLGERSAWAPWLCHGH